MMPPLLPLKFGNGLLLQYTVNTPGRDDKLGLMEVGLGVGVTSLALVLLSAVASYMLKSVPLLVEMEDRKRKTVARLLRMFDIAVGMLQVVLLLVLFIFTVFFTFFSIFTKVNRFSVDHIRFSAVPHLKLAKLIGEVL